MVNVHIAIHLISDLVVKFGCLHLAVFGMVMECSKETLLGLINDIKEYPSQTIIPKAARRNCFRHMMASSRVTEWKGTSADQSRRMT